MKILTPGRFLIILSNVDSKITISLKEQNKKIVMAGLDLLADRTEWSNYTEMKKLCDREIKLKAECTKCGKELDSHENIVCDKCL